MSVSPWVRYLQVKRRKDKTLWEKEKESTPGCRKDFQVTESQAGDVSEGKNNPIYNAHSYHTKVPYPVIMRYILHYPQPDLLYLLHIVRPAS